MAFVVHDSLTHKKVSNARTIAVTMAINNDRLSTIPLNCPLIIRMLMPINRLVIFTAIPINLCVTREATTFPLTPFCSLVTKYALVISPLMDSAGMIMSINTPYQTYKKDLKTDSFTERKVSRECQDKEKKNISNITKTIATK
jgi:hypothetical protein